MEGSGLLGTRIFHESYVTHGTFVRFDRWLSRWAVYILGQLQLPDVTDARIAQIQRSSPLARIVPPESPPKTEVFGTGYKLGICSYWT